MDEPTKSREELLAELERWIAELASRIIKPRSVRATGLLRCYFWAAGPLSFTSLASSTCNRPTSLSGLPFSISISAGGVPEAALFPRAGRGAGTAPRTTRPCIKPCWMTGSCRRTVGPKGPAGPLAVRCKGRSRRAAVGTTSFARSADGRTLRGT
jgi:hypothetical protein